jgi:hypothetical protein
LASQAGSQEQALHKAVDDIESNVSSLIELEDESEFEGEQNRLKKMLAQFKEEVI